MNEYVYTVHFLLLLPLRQVVSSAVFMTLILLFNHICIFEFYILELKQLAHESINR